MEDSDIQKFVLSQAAAEVEYNRSWPTKIMAFYIAINFGIATALITLRNDFCSLGSSCIAKAIITILLLILAAWTLRVLWRNHKNYLNYRNLQIFNQKKILEKKKDDFGVLDDWFVPLKERALTRFFGWGFYAYIVVMTSALVIVGMWLII
jgi:hypothetical protein